MTNTGVKLLFLYQKTKGVLLGTFRHVKNRMPKPKSLYEGKEYPKGRMFFFVTSELFRISIPLFKKISSKRFLFLADE